MEGRISRLCICSHWIMCYFFLTVLLSPIKKGDNMVISIETLLSLYICGIMNNKMLSIL